MDLSTPYLGLGSLNGISAEGWLYHAGLIQQAGADALELNLYAVTSDPNRSAAAEAEQLAMIQQIKANATIPVALKLSPYYTSLAHFVPVQRRGRGRFRVVQPFLPAGFPFRRTRDRA